MRSKNIFETGTWKAPLVCALLAFGLIAAPSAAKPRRAAVVAEPSLTVQQSDPHLGDAVTFSVVYPSDVSYPRIAVRCYGSDGAMTYGEAGAYNHAFVLGGAGSDWLRQGGAAHCTGELFYFSEKGNRPQEVTTLAWTSFEAGG